jgi:hypothetical protein
MGGCGIEFGEDLCSIAVEGTFAADLPIFVGSGYIVILISA